MKKSDARVFLVLHLLLFSVTISGVTVFHEKVRKKKPAALGLIVAGILVFTI